MATSTPSGQVDAILFVRRRPTPPFVGRQGNARFRALAGRRMADSVNHVPVLSWACAWLVRGTRDLGLLVWSPIAVLTALMSAELGVTSTIHLREFDFSRNPRTTPGHVPGLSKTEPVKDQACCGVCGVRSDRRRYPRYPHLLSSTRRWRASRPAPVGTGEWP